MLQNVFETKQSTTDSLYNFVSSYLTEESAANLALYRAPPKRVIKQGLSLVEAGLTSTTLLHAGGAIVVREDVKVESDPSGAQEQLSSVVGKPDIVSETTKLDSSKAPAPVNRVEQQNTSSSSSRAKEGKPVPKWFKLK